MKQYNVFSNHYQTKSSSVQQGWQSSGRGRRQPSFSGCTLMLASWLAGGSPALNNHDRDRHHVRLTSKQQIFTACMSASCSTHKMACIPVVMTSHNDTIMLGMFHPLLEPHTKPPIWENRGHGNPSFRRRRPLIGFYSSRGVGGEWKEKSYVKSYINCFWSSSKADLHRMVQ